METITGAEINLFAEQLPSIEQLKELAATIHSSESNIIDFNKTLEEQSSLASPLAIGIGSLFLGQLDAAIEKLSQAPDSQEKFIYLSIAHRKKGDYEKAIGAIEKSLSSGVDKSYVTLEKAAIYRDAKNYDAAGSELSTCSGLENTSGEYHYQLARLNEAQGAYETAADNYKKALELSPEHQKALFHLAYRCDLSGDEEAAVDYYKQITKTAPVFVTAYLNLAILYEDAGEYIKASDCIDMVLKYHPNHQRARLFQKDIESSKTMFYDEEKEQKQNRKHQILETPISDFELSVRSRNCLRKMKIFTIGDLLQITEAELLSYKNFGETSLKEIKVILDSKSLRLGLALDEGQDITMDTGSFEQEAEDFGDEEIHSKLINDLQLSVRSKKCIENLNIRTVGELLRRTEAELLGCKNFGVTSLNEIQKALENIGLSLRKLED